LRQQCSEAILCLPISLRELWFALILISDFTASNARTIFRPERAAMSDVDADDNSYDDQRDSRNGKQFSEHRPHRLSKPASVMTGELHMAAPFDAGADDYIIKCRESFRVLLARIQAMLIMFPPLVISDLQTVLPGTPRKRRSSGISNYRRIE
jgi:hypothetical protein